MNEGVIKISNTTKTKTEIRIVVKDDPSICVSLNRVGIMQELDDVMIVKKDDILVFYLSLV
jgi:hypothetical protein